MQKHKTGVLLKLPKFLRSTSLLL